MWIINLYRANGRFVKQLGRPYRAKYAAKQKLVKHEEKYDVSSYYLKIEKFNR